MSEEEIAQMIPPRDAVFACGFAGDPVTGQAWPKPGEKLCSTDSPFQVVSPFTQTIYGIQKPGEKYYDDGSGWVRPEDGKRFYFRGVWNSSVIAILHKAVDDLSISYMLTGDAIYADRALFILDRIATLRAQRSSTDSPIDWPKETHPGFGFFCYEENLANDRMFLSALAFDLIGKSAAAAEPSSLDSKITRFENIRRNYFSVFNKERLNGGVFHNHSLAVYVSALSQGLLFGIPEAIRQGIDICYGFLDNAIDRNGEYFEQSALYDGLGRQYGGRILVLLSHYNPQNYPNPAEFPDPKQFPYDLRFGNDPVWFQTAVGSLYSLTVLYRRSQYGDADPDRFTSSDDTNDAKRKAIFLKLFYYQTDNSEWKDLCAKLYWSLPESAREDKESLHSGIIMWGPSQAMQPPKPANLEIPRDFQQNASVVSSQKRIAILRSGSGSDQRAIFMQGGAGNLHGHDDQMAISLYSDEMALTGEYGYHLYGTPDHSGYGTRAIAHQLVVVDEGRDRPFFASYPPAKIEGYLPFGPAQFIEMNSPAMWPRSHLSEYRRQTWLVDISKEKGYFVDFFRVDGGRKQDYVWTAPYRVPSSEKDLKLENIDPISQKNIWSLAGMDPEYRDAIFNQPGKSWGERLEASSGTMRNIGIPGEKLPFDHWTPPPGNGYGFIWDIKTAETDRDWSATWLLLDGRHSMRMTMVNQNSMTVIRGKAPCLKPGCYQNVVIARREAKGDRPLKGLFATVTQTSVDDNWPLKRIEPIKGLDPSEAGVFITHEDNSRDLLLALQEQHECKIPGVRLIGKNAFVRRDPSGEVSKIILSEGTELEVDGLSVRLPKDGWDAEVIKVQNDSITVNSNLPAAERLAGNPVFFSSPPEAAIPYFSNEFFTIEDIQNDGHGGAVLKFNKQRVRAGRLKIQSKNASGVIATVWSNELAALLTPESNAHVFDGHLLVKEDEPTSSERESTIITAYTGKKEMLVRDPEMIEPGKYYDLMAVAPQDRMRIPSFAILEKQEKGSWSIRANMDAEVRLTKAHTSWILKNADGGETNLKINADGAIHIPIASLEKGEGLLIPSSVTKEAKNDK